MGATGCTPTSLGIFLPFINGAVGANEITTEARALGVHTIRFSQDVTQPVRPTFAIFARNGIKVVLDVHNDPQPNANGHNVSHPPASPGEVAVFRQQVANTLDGMPAPRLVQVENEENSTAFFQGRMPDYVNELNATVEAAHARDIKVTNGGITSRPLALLTWQDLEDRGLTPRPTTSPPGCSRTSPRSCRTFAESPSPACATSPSRALGTAPRS